MGTLTDIILRITELVYAVVPVLVALALLFFFWGLAQWILNMADTEKHQEGKQRMIWGLVALFVIGSIGGLILILQNTLFNTGGLHNPLLRGPNYLGGTESNNSLNVDVGEGSFGTSLEGGHTVPGAETESNNSFRIIGEGSTETVGEPAPTSFEPYNVRSWGCLFRDCSETRR